MPKASTADIKFYKGVQLVKIHEQLVKDKAGITLNELDKYLKSYADLEDMSSEHYSSCSCFSHEETQDLKEMSKQFACSIKMGFDYFDKHKDNGDLDFNRTEKQ